MNEPKDSPSLSGLPLIDKQSGITSHDAVDAVRRIAKMRAVGHAGTLDPMATGLLILGLGKGTKKLNELQGLDKTYEATLKLGATSDTFDAEGVITTLDNPPTLTLAEIEVALDQFRGGYEQKAPLHSAKKIKGKKLYELARSGQATEEMRPSKHITLHELKVLEYSYPNLRIHVHCSTGTYIRSLADDIGRALKSGAYLTALRRLSIGAYDVKEAISLKELDEKTLSEKLISIA